MKNYLLILALFLSFQTISFSQYGYETEVNRNIIIPIGKNTDDYNFGFGGLVGFYYDITEIFRLAFVTGYLRAGMKKSNIKMDLTSGGQSANLDVSDGVGSIPALLSLILISPDPGMRMYGLMKVDCILTAQASLAHILSVHSSQRLINLNTGLSQN